MFVSLFVTRTVLSFVNLERFYILSIFDDTIFFHMATLGLIGKLKLEKITG